MKKERFKKFFDVLKIRFQHAETSSSAVLLAYYALLAVFPLAIAMGTLLPYLNLDPASVMAYIDIILPDSVEPLLDGLVTSLFTVKSGGFLWFGIFGLLWSVSRGAIYLQTGLNRAYGLEEPGSYIARRLTSVAVTMLLLFVAVLFAVVLNLGTEILDFLAGFIPELDGLAELIGDLKWPVTIPFVFCCLWVIYLIAPDVKIRVRRALAGAAFATAGLLALTQLFSLYLRFIANRLSAYGALASVFVLMFWLYFSAIILLLGGLLNAALNEYLDGAPAVRNRGLDLMIENRILSAAHRGKKDGGGEAKEDEPGGKE